MAARASDRDLRLIDLTEMTLEDIAGLDAALIDEAVGELLARCGTSNRLWACQVRAVARTSESLPASRA
jgi:hypothetical protein